MSLFQSSPAFTVGGRPPRFLTLRGSTDTISDLAFDDKYADYEPEPDRTSVADACATVTDPGNVPDLE